MLPSARSSRTGGVMCEETSEAISPFDLGYAMGLIVGEGSFTGDRVAPALSVRLHELDPQPLRFRRRTLGGRIYGPYHHDGRHYRLYHLRGVDLRERIPLFLYHLPPSRKRLQFVEWAIRYRLLARVNDGDE